MMGLGAFSIIIVVIFAPWIVVAIISGLPPVLPLLVLVVMGGGVVKQLYRPRENYVGAINMFGRFYRLVNPNEWFIRIPLVQRVRCESNLGVRAVPVELRDVMTRDNVPINIDLLVIYQYDLRCIEPGLLINFLGAEESKINSLILTNMQVIARNEIVINMRYASLCSSGGRESLTRMLGNNIAKRVQALGVRIRPEFGVKITNLQPNELFQKALCLRSAAVTQGRAAMERLQPFLEEMRNRDPNAAWEAIEMMFASAMVQDGEIPPAVIPLTQPAPYSQYVDGAHRAVLYPKANKDT